LLRSALDIVVPPNSAISPSANALSSPRISSIPSPAASPRIPTRRASPKIKFPRSQN